MQHKILIAFIIVASIVLACYILSGKVNFFGQNSGGIEQGSSPNISGELPKLLGYHDKSIENRVNKKIDDHFQQYLSCFETLPQDDLNYDFLLTIKNEALIKEGKKYDVNSATNGLSVEQHRALGEKARSTSRKQMIAKLSQYSVLKYSGDVTYFKNDIFSILVKTSYNCNTLNPFSDPHRRSYLEVPLTFDLESGKPVDLKDLFDNFEKDKSLILEIIFAYNESATPKIADQEASNDKGKICEGDDPSVFFDDEARSFKYHISESGLVVKHTSSVHGISSSCFNRATLPLSEISKLELYLHKGSILNRIIYKDND